MSEALNILHAESSLGWGGQENRTLNEMLALRRLGQRPMLVTQPGARLAERARAADFPVAEIRMRNAVDLAAVWRLRRLIGAWRIDVVNTHSGRDSQVAGLAARLSRRRPLLVRTRHLALPITSRYTYVTLPQHVVAVSRYVRDYLVSAGVPPTRVSAVPTGIDLAPFAALPASTLRAELGLGRETPLVGTVAILRQKKGHRYLLDAVPAILERVPAAHFVFAGDGPQTDNLRARIGELGLRERVHLLGLRRDVHNVLAGLDLFVLPTLQEALGTSFIEAMAAGVPAIGSRVDGVPEVLGDGECGVLVPPADSAALATAVADLLLAPARRRELAAAGRRRVAASYSVEVMGQGMLDLYRRLGAGPDSNAR